ncbi:sugar kinase [Solwaraspora sp. WMMD406]|uniref:sugar kinase n=1 Tax=Solwaraspora sp. WMMD406 TaxID=3016095 RepID=UPI00241803B5|nr:sugar kinase [Solwaraspora sp. WMMD406]MDG4766787.1 sugar kinase [Solwaraspora sp. WMMD406]
MILTVRPAAECRFDLVSLGEVMLRLDPGEGRVRTARTFAVSEGGGEYNVARGLRRGFGLRTAVVTALADNEVGRLVENLMLQGGVDTSLIRWVPDDGVGRAVRNGLNFTERGHGVRGAVGVSDRGRTAVSQLGPADVDWDHLFGVLGVRWLHTGGIYVGLSEAAADTAATAVAAARRHGTIVSYDLNYRSSLWRDVGGQDRARHVNQRIAGMVDVMIGNEDHFTTVLGSDAPDTDADLSYPGVDRAERSISRVVRAYPGISIMAATLRTVRTATVNDWGAIGWSADTGFVAARHRPGLRILDRVGGGDGFACGAFHGLLEHGDLRVSLESGTAHGALAMTTPGDTSMASLPEVEALAAGSNARVRR